MMRLSCFCCILSVCLLKSRCSADPEPEDLFSLDDLEKPDSIGDLTSGASLLSNVNVGDLSLPSLSSSPPALIGSSKLFPEANSGNDDDDNSSPFFENENDASPFALTDATLLSACPNDQSSVDEQQQPLLTARDDSSCSRPPPVPLSPHTIQLFEDPLDSLERATTPTNSDQDTPSPSGAPNVEPGYPGLLDPEEQQWRERNPGGMYHNKDPVQGEYWHDYEGEVIYGNGDGDYQHCQMYLQLGYVYALCCRQARTRLLPPHMPEYYPTLEECDPNVGMYEAFR